jgi:DNA-binding LytR/AlgR family response regulator
MKKALIVEDEAVALEDLRDSLATIVPEAQITGVRTATEALEILARESFDAIFLDVELPGMTGIQMLERLPKPTPPVVLVTAHALHALDGFGLGVVECLLKPVDHQRLRRAVERIDEHPPTELPVAMRKMEILHPEARVFARNGLQVWFVLIEDLWMVEDEGHQLRVTFKNGNGIIQGDPMEFRSLLDPMTFFHASATVTINMTAVDHFLETPQGQMSAVFPGGQIVEFDQQQSQVFVETHGL